MRIAGLPVWALVLVACAAAPLLIHLWIDAEQRRAKERTRSMLRRFVPTTGSPVEIASGTGRAASTGRETDSTRSGNDADDRGSD